MERGEPEASQDPLFVIDDPSESGQAKVGDSTEAGIAQRLDSLLERFDAKIARDEAKEAAFEYIYQQREEQSAGFVESIKRPLLHALLRLYDDVTSTLRGDISDEARQAVEGIRDDLLDLLENEDVVRVDSVEVLDRSIHKVVKSLACDDPAMHLNVARVIRHGFRLRDRLLRPEEVVVYLCSSSETAKDEATTAVEAQEGFNNE